MRLIAFNFARLKKIYTIEASFGDSGQFSGVTDDETTTLQWQSTAEKVGLQADRHQRRGRLWNRPEVDGHDVLGCTWNYL